MDLVVAFHCTKRFDEASNAFFRVLLSCRCALSLVVALVCEYSGYPAPVAGDRFPGLRVGQAIMGCRAAATM